MPSPNYQLEWDKTGERLYEMGVSRGVLYPSPYAGYAVRTMICPFEYKPRKQTNADNIRRMSDEELVEAWYYIYYHIIFASTDSRRGLLDWLQQEVEE